MAHATKRVDASSPYRSAILNTARFIRGQNIAKLEKGRISAFQASEVLAIAFCKSKEDVIMDLIMVELDEAEVG